MSRSKSILGRQMTYTHMRRMPRKLAAAFMSLILLVMSLVGTAVVSTGVASATPATGTISGTVTNPDNSPAADVSVFITDTNFDSFNATTDASGNYTIAGVTPTAAGDHYTFDMVGTDPTGAVYDYYNNPIAPVTVSAGQSLTGENTKLVAPGSISGTVTAGGSPVANVNVVAIDVASMSMATTGSATTDASGHYVITGLAPTSTGHYTVSFDTSSFPAPGYAPNTYSDKADSSTATLVGAMSTGTTGIDAHLVVGSTVSGKVVDGNGNAIANADVTLSPLDFASGIQYFSATTDSNGDYEISGLPAAAFTLWIDSIDSQYQSTSIGNPILVPAAANLIGHDLVAPLEDSTTTGSAHGIVRDTDGNPIAGVQVNLYSATGATNTDGSTVTYSATTDVNGKYSITGIASDNYDVRISDYPTYGGYDLASDRTSHGDPGDGSVTIDGNIAEQVDATLTKNAIFSGTITDSNSNPIPTGQVNAVLINPANGNVVQIDEVTNGTWQLVGPAGTYKIEFSSGPWHGSYVDEWWNNAATEATATPLTVTAGQVTSNMNVVLQPTPPAATVPGTPTNVSATAGDGSATVSWTAPASNGGAAIENYFVTEYIGGVQQDITSASGTSTTITGLTNGTTYTFKVTAHNTVGDGPASSASNPVTPAAAATAPGAPTGAHATAGNAQATVSWTAPASNGGAAITGYTVASTPGSKTCATIGATTCTVSGLTNGTSYTFQVTATNSVGTSAASNASNSVTPAAPTAPGAPTGSHATAGNAQATVSWTAPASNGGAAITGYTVASTPGNKTCTTTGATSCTVTGLTNGTAYTFKVTATNSVGTSPASAASNSITPAVPANTANESFVIAAYTDFLGRAPTAGELSNWAGQLDAGTSRKTLLDALANSNEWISHIVAGFYNDTLGRLPDQSGMDYWVGVISSSKMTVAQVAAHFYSSNEYFRTYGHSALAIWVTDLYSKVLHRSATGSDQTYWAHQASAHGRQSVAYSIYQSSESRRDRVTTLYGELLHRAPDPGGKTYWTNRLTSVGDIALAEFLAGSSEYFSQAQSRFP